MDRYTHRQIDRQTDNRQMDRQIRHIISLSHFFKETEPDKLDRQINRYISIDGQTNNTDSQMRKIDGQKDKKIKRDRQIGYMYNTHFLLCKKAPMENFN